MACNAWRAVGGGLALTLVLADARPVSAQAVFRPTPEPLVTAENERWYLEGRPIAYGDGLYYPTGPLVFFNGYEMLRSGNYFGVPLYIRGSADAVSRVYVPLAGGVLHPYERPRTGPLAGTVGSATPSFPGTVATSAPDPTYDGVAAPSAGLFGSDPLPEDAARPTTGVIPVPPDPRYPLASARRPEGLNGVFIRFDGQRWFSDGPAIDLDPAQFRSAGDLGGLPVYRRTGDTTNTIYVVVAKQTPLLLAPYTARR